VLAKVNSRHAGVSHATVARLLLKTAAILRQGLLSKEECAKLHRHLEGECVCMCVCSVCMRMCLVSVSCSHAISSDGDVDLVHAIVSSVGCRPEPNMPLEVLSLSLSLSLSSFCMSFFFFVSICERCKGWRGKLGLCCVL